MDLTSVERFERQTHKSVCRTQARRHRASITITALPASKKQSGRGSRLQRYRPLVVTKTVVRSRRARVRFLTPNGQQTEMIRADQRHRFLVHLAFQAPYTRLVGRIGDGEQLRAGIAAPDDFDPSRQVLLEVQVFIFSSLPL